MHVAKRDLETTIFPTRTAAKPADSLIRT